MTYYVILKNQTIQIIPRWKIKLPTRKHLTDEEFVQEAALLALNGEFYIPLSKFKIDKVPQQVAILHGKSEYKTLNDFVDYIYSVRSYTSDEKSAKNRIQGLAIKAIMTNKELYGKKLSYRFDFIDASNYNVIL